MAKRPWEKPAQPTRDLSAGHLPFAPFPEKKVPCPRCGQLGENTGKRNPEGQFIFTCRPCKIQYSQHLKLGFCTAFVNDKNGHQLREKKTGNMVLVRTIKPSDCRKCSIFPGRIRCPHFKGKIGKELEPPEQWDKA